MKLYFAPGACSLGIRVLLEEIGKPYEAATIDLRDGGQFKAEYTRINPKSKVPTLVRDDGSILTEWPAIAFWLARSNPDRRLLPTDREAEARTIEATSYIVATLHMQGFTRLFRPANFAPSPADEEKVKETGRKIVDKGLALIDGGLTGKDYIVGEFSIADAALFYTEFWCAARLNIPLAPNCRAHYQRMTARPAVSRALRQEGLNP